MEELLDSTTHISDSRSGVRRLKDLLRCGRDPGLLGELADHHLSTGSAGALEVLLSLRDFHAQDFFDKLNESILRKACRLSVLQLLARTINAQVSWLYKMAHHQLLHSIIYLLKTSSDVAVLTSAVLVTAAFLPLVPSYIGPSLPDLCSLLDQLATIRNTSRLGSTPKQLALHLDVAVYYLFLQLYSMFPCTLYADLHARFGSPGRERDFQEFIMPLLQQVQFHPALVTDDAFYETSKSKWGSMDPHEIATLSLSLCLDPAIMESWDAAPWAPQGSGSNRTPFVEEQAVKTAASGSPGPSMEEEEDGSLHTKPTTSDGNSVPSILVNSGSVTSRGYLSAQQLASVWSPSLEFGQVTPSEVSGQVSAGPLTSALPSPAASDPSASGSTSASALHTPGPTPSSSSASALQQSSTSNSGNHFSFNNITYSPSTASLDSESLLNRHAPSLTQSALHTPLHSEDLQSSIRSDQPGPAPPLSGSVGGCQDSPAVGTGGGLRSSSNEQLLRQSTHSTMSSGEHHHQKSGSGSLKVSFDRFLGGLFSLPNLPLSLVNGTGHTCNYTHTHTHAHTHTPGTISPHHVS